MRNTFNSQKRRGLTAAAAVATVGMMMAGQQAHAQTTGVATLSVSAFAPTGADLAQPNFNPYVNTTYGANDQNYVGYQDFVDNGNDPTRGGPGQVFNLSTGLTLNSLTVKGNGGSSAASAFAGDIWTITLGTASYLGTGAVITTLNTETVDVANVLAAGNTGYITFNFANPTALSAGTNYVYSIKRTTGDAYIGFAKTFGATDVLPNGASMTADLSGTGVFQTDFVHNSPTTGGFQDRTFFLNGVAGPAPVVFTAQSTNWVKNGNGAWESAPNWASNPQVPGAPGSNVIFDGNFGTITVSPVVTLGQAATLTTATFDLPGGGYTINNSGGGTISLEAQIDVLSGNHVINVPVTATTSGGAGIFTAVAGSSLTIDRLATPGFGTARFNGGGNFTIGGNPGNININVSSPNAGVTPGGNLTFKDGSTLGFFYAINLDVSSSINVGVNTVQTSGIYGNGVLTIPAGGVVHTAVFGDNPFNSARITGAGSFVVNNLGNTGAPRYATLTNANTDFTGTITVGSNVGLNLGVTVSNQHTLRIAAGNNMGDGSATNRLILDGGILQATASFVATQNVTVTNLAGKQAGSTITDSKIDTNGFDISLGAVTSAGKLTKISAGKLTVANVRGGSLQVDAGTVAVANNASRTAGVSVLDGLTLAGATGAWTSLLDLGNNDLIVRNGDAATIRDQIKQGFGTGTQNGTGGILSSAAATATAPATALGYGTVVGMIDGIATTATDVVIRYTVSGDSNLDLIVNFDDLLALAQNYNNPGAVWSQGDSNYDGTVNFDDLLVLAQNYNQNLLVDGTLLYGTGGSSFAADLALAQSLVPEPTTLLGLGAIGTLVTMRRRK